MKLTRTFLPLLCLSLGSAWAAPTPPHPTQAPSRTALGLAGLRELSLPVRIRVRLAEAAPKVQIRGSQLSIWEDGRAARLPAGEASDEWELRCQEGRVRAVRAGGGGGLDLREPVRVRAGAGFVSFRDRPYRGELEIRSVGSFCEVVDQVELEHYLAGLVNSEFNSKWNEEAIGAQIVAARTYALYQMSASREDPHRHFDVDATVRDQVYDGSIKEDPKAQRLVERTRGWVLTVGGSSKPAPLKAFYHSTCGGVTELPEQVWGNSFAGFRHAVRCPFCGGSPAFNWKLDLTVADVVEAFRRAVQGSDEVNPDWARSWPRSWRQVIAARRLLDLRIRSRDPQGRVAEVITSWAYTDAATGRQTLAELSLSGARLREWVGPSRLRSASFEVLARSRGAWQVSGRGNGHGVGMCQWGAKTMGERGYKTASILKYYYPDAVLRKFW